MRLVYTAFAFNSLTLHNSAIFPLMTANMV